MGMNAKRGVFAGLIAALVGVAVAGFAQVIENPAKPMATNAGRVVAPEEVLAISDEGTSEFYFKWPRGLRTAADGSLLLTDEDQVLEFDAKGQFVRNLFKKGQGPGEMPYAGACLPTDKAIIVYSGYPSKLVFFSPSGRYEREVPVRPEGQTRLTLIGHRAGRLYFESGEFPRTPGDPDVIDNPRTIVAVSDSDGSITPRTTFVTRAWVVSSPSGGGGMFSITSLIAVPFGRDLLALAHTEDYLVKIYRPGGEQGPQGVPAALRARQAGAPHGRAEEGRDDHQWQALRSARTEIRERRQEPARPGWRDLGRDFDAGTRPRAFSSTSSTARASTGTASGSSFQSRHSASLWSPGQCALDGEFLWVVERSEDETFAIKKYRVVI